MIQYNSKSIYVIGGVQNGSISNNTWILDPTNNFQIRKGPSLNVARMEYSCGKLEVNGKLYLIVAGGWIGRYGLGSVELLDPSSSQGWISGMYISGCQKNHFMSYNREKIIYCTYTY